MSIHLYKTLSFWEELLLWFLFVLVQLLLRAHTIDHVHHIYRCDVNLLFLCSQRPLSRLQTLFLVLLLFSSLLWIFTDSTFICVTEEYGLLLGVLSLIVHLGFFVFFDKNTVDGLVNSLGRSLLEVFFLAITFQVKNIFKKWVIDSFSLLLFSFLNSNIVACVFNVWNHPVIDIFWPLSSLFNSHIFVSWNELVDNQMLLSNISS